MRRHMGATINEGFKIPWAESLARIIASGSVWALKPCSALVIGRGWGKTSRMETAGLWTQDAVDRQEFLLVKVGGGDNPTDVLTKPVPPRGAVVRHLVTSGCRGVHADVEVRRCVCVCVCGCLYSCPCS